MSKSEQQSILTQIVPEETTEIQEKLEIKNALSVVLNRIRSIEEQSQTLLTETEFLRQQLEEFFNEH